MGFYDDCRVNIIQSIIHLIWQILYLRKWNTFDDPFVMGYAKLMEGVLNLSTVVSCYVANKTISNKIISHYNLSQFCNLQSVF